MSRCGIVILAAGGSRRLGRPKQLLEKSGVSLLRRCISTAVATECQPIVIILGAASDTLTPLLANEPVTVRLNPHWASGIGTSIRAGVAALDSKCDAAVLMLCDQPLITTQHISELIRLHTASGKPIAAAGYNQSVGTPAVFSSSLFGELLALSDDQGGKAVIRRHPDEVEEFNLPEAAIDIDTEDDFTRWSAAPPNSIQ